VSFSGGGQAIAGAIELNPSLPGLQGLYGQALLNTGDPDAAADAFQKELVSDPNHFEANLYLAQILLARAKWERCGSPGAACVASTSDSLEANLEMADSECWRGQAAKSPPRT